MMTDQHLPILEATPMLDEMPLDPHMLSRDGMQQMVLVQVNPGETFTISTDDGQVQHRCPWYPLMALCPPFLSQVVEENGMWKLLVLPHMMEFYPSLLPVPPHIPIYTPPQPAMLHYPHLNPSELSPYYIHPLPALPVYTEQGEREH